MRKIMALMALGLAAFLVVRAQLFVSSETDRLPPQTDEDVRNLLLIAAMDYFFMEEERPPNSIEEFQQHPVAWVLNIWDYVQPLQEGEEPPPGYAGWRIENGELVFYLRYRDSVFRTVSRPWPLAEREMVAMRVQRQRFAPTPQDAGLYYICTYLRTVAEYGQESLNWFRSPYEAEALKWSTLDNPQPVSISPLGEPYPWLPAYVCWNENREPVNPSLLATYHQAGGKLLSSLLPFVEEYEQWSDATPEIQFTPEELLGQTS